MVYKQLSLSAGGGVTDNRNKADQPTRATIAIGLGGTGIECLRIFKQRVYDCIQPDDPNAVVPTYSHFKFLAVDANELAVEYNGQPNDINPTTEYFDLSVGHLESFLRAIGHSLDSSHWAWYRDGNGAKPALLSVYGSGGVRRVGRAMLMNRSAGFVDCIARLIREATIGSSIEREVHVYIFTGMGGGIGSGTFLDVCYLVQHALQITGAYEQSRIFGYSFLPDVTLSKPWFAGDINADRYIKANSYAFMKELDYCMNFDRNQGHWEQHYQGFEVAPTTRPPVDICYLVSSGDINGRSLADSRTPMEAVAEQILFANPSVQFSGLIRAPGRYAILGVSGVKAPCHEMINYLVARVFDEMAKIGTKKPTDADVLTFANEHGLTFKGLFRSLMDKASYQMPILQLDYKIYTSMEETDLALPDEVHLPSSILDAYRLVEQKMVNRVETNKQVLLHEWNKDNIEEEQDSISKMCQIYYALSDVVSDATKGPRYAAAILKANGCMNLVDLLKCVLKEVQTAVSQEDRNTSWCISTIKKARTDFLHPGLRGIGRSRAKLFEIFLQTIQQYKTAQCKRYVLCELESLVRSLIEQMDALYDHHLRVYAQVTENLTNTFYENIIYLRRANERVGSSVLRSFMSLEQLQDVMDSILGRMNMAAMFGSFHTHFFRKHDVWIDGDENRIRKTVTDWSRNNVYGGLNLSFTDFMEMALQTDHPETLIRYFCQNILKPCYQNCVPNFLAIPEFSCIDKTKIVNCIIPAHLELVQNAANMLEQMNPDVYAQVGRVRDRVSMTCYACGISLEEYRLAKACRDAYQACLHHGLHIYEGTLEDPRDWKQLPDIVQ